MQTEAQEAELDLVWGLAAIAKIIGRTERQTHYMLQTGRLPAKQIGIRWVAKRSALVNFFNDIAA